MDLHGLAEARSLAFHRAVGERLASDPLVLERARARVEKWLATGKVHEHWARQWRDVLSRSVEEIREFLVEDSERARALRQVTPFAGAIDPRTRWRIWREVRQSLDSAAP